MIPWMGRYRTLAEALVRHVNQVNRTTSIEFNIGDGIWLNGYAWQVLEYLYEYESSDDPMLRVSETLRIAQSTYSKIIKQLQKYGLVEKYHLSSNRKNVIVRISQNGKTAYEQYAVQLTHSSWQLFFNRLDHLPDDAIAAFTQALDLLTSGLPSNSDENDEHMKKLIRIN